MVQKFSMSVPKDAWLLWKGHDYNVAFLRADGEFEVVERFLALNDADANAYAEANYSNRLSPSNDEWYVLDGSGRNINGGE